MKLTSVALLLSVAGASARFTPLKPESLAVRSAGSKDAALEFRGKPRTVSQSPTSFFNRLPLCFSRRSCQARIQGGQRSPEGEKIGVLHYKRLYGFFTSFIY